MPPTVLVHFPSRVLTLPHLSQHGDWIPRCHRQVSSAGMTQQQAATLEINQLNRTMWLTGVMSDHCFRMELTMLRLVQQSTGGHDQRGITCGDVIGIQ